MLAFFVLFVFGGGVGDEMSLPILIPWMEELRPSLSPTYGTLGCLLESPSCHQVQTVTP